MATMKAQFAAACCVCASVCASFCAPAVAAQKIVPAQSGIAFVSKQMGVPVQGRFEHFDGTINVDPAKPENARISFTVDLGSVSIGTPETALELRKPEWFDTAKSANATFASTGIKSVGAGKLDVAGKLTIKGIVRDIHVPLTYVRQGDVLTVDGEFTVKRLDYRIGGGEWGDTGLVADEVVVKAHLTVAGTPGP